ncbi:MAG: hypothetical protein WDO70_06195 [Alphaproteobacteria bacterium]
MQQLQQFKFYDLGAKLYGVFNLRNHGRVADLFGPLTDAQKSLDALIKGDPIELKLAKGEASKLLTQISALFDKYFIDKTNRQLRFPSGEEKVDPQELALIQLALEKFESALAAELSRIVVYPAVQRGIYSSVDLIENAHLALPESAQAYVSAAAKRELDSAGRAIGFELGTAATVHALRALETVTVSYYELFAAPLTGRNERNLTTYLRKLAALADEEDLKTRPDQRLVQLLTQIKDSYRNPVMHADAIVEVGTAASLFGLVTSAIAQIAEQIAAHQEPQAKASSTAAAESSTVISPMMPDEAKPGLMETDDGEDVYDFRISQAG